MFKINLLCTERCNDSEVAVADINSYELLPEIMSDDNCITASMGGDVTIRPPTKTPCHVPYTPTRPTPRPHATSHAHTVYPPEDSMAHSMQLHKGPDHLIPHQRNRKPRKDLHGNRTPHHGHKAPLVPLHLQNRTAVVAWNW